MHKFKHIILAVAIAIVFVFFVGFGISSFYPAPKYENYCNTQEFKQYNMQNECESGNGKWIVNEATRPVPEKMQSGQLLCTKLSEKDNAVSLSCETLDQLTNQGYCDLYYYCNQAFQDVNEKYNRNVFIIATGIGIIALIAGIALKLVSVSAGFMGGGVLTIIYGTVRYWSDLPDYGRFIILGIALAILIWLGYKRISK